MPYNVNIMVLKLFRSKKFSKRILLALLVLIVPAFVLWGVGSMARRPELVGQIGKQKVHLDNFEKSRQGARIQLLLTYYNDYNTLNQMFKNRIMVNYIAWERLILLNETNTRKIKISNNDVLLFISQHPLFQRNDIFSQEIYNYILRNTLSIEPRQFEELVRENLKIQSLRQDLVKDISISEEELKEAYRRANDKVELSYVFIDKDLFTKQVEVSDEEIRTLYDTNKDKFFEPAKIEIEYVESTFYGNTSQKEYVTGEFEKIYLELKKSPELFSEIAEKNKMRYGKPEAFSEEDIISEIPFFKKFQETAFALKEGEISSPIFSGPEQGFAYILHKLKNIARRQQNLDEAWGNITEILTANKCLLLAKEKAEKLYTEIKELDMPLEEAARSLKQKIKTTDKPVSSNGYIENIGPAKEIVLRAFETTQDTILPPITVPNGAVIARAGNISPAKEDKFDEQKEDLRKNLLLPKQISTIENWFKENQSNVKLMKELEEL